MTDMHEKAMRLLCQRQAKPVEEYAPIAKSLVQLDPHSMATLRKKFDIAYFIAKEKLAFSKMKPLCELEERHGADLGEKYKTNIRCAELVAAIGQELKKDLANALTTANFFSIQCDGSTDAGNVDEELFLALYLDKEAEDGLVHVRNKLFTVQALSSGTGEGLFKCLVSAMDYVGVESWEKKLIGLGCDGTNANIAAGGLRGHLRKAVRWAVVFWCLAHRLELALKDALKATFFTSVNELLLQIYFLYEKSPKKCRELTEVVDELRKCLEVSEMPAKGEHKS